MTIAPTDDVVDLLWIVGKILNTFSGPHLVLCNNAKVLSI